MYRIAGLVLVLTVFTAIPVDASPAAELPSQRSVRDAAGDATRACTTSPGSQCGSTGWPTWDLRRVHYAAKRNGLRITWNVLGIAPGAGIDSWVETHGASLFWNNQLQAIVEVRPTDRDVEVYWATDGHVPGTNDRAYFAAGKNPAMGRVSVLIPWNHLTCPDRLRIRAVNTLRNYPRYRRLIDERAGSAISAPQCV